MCNDGKYHKMTTDEYKLARKELGYKIPEWIEKLGISIDTHKSYNSGRKEVQAPVANHIETLLELENIKKSVSDALK